MSNRKSLPSFLRLKTSNTSLSTAASVQLPSPEKPRLSEEAFYIEPSESEEEKSGEMEAEYVQSRPLSVAIPRSLEAQGPYCPRRPNLSDILANNAPPPWTLSAFMAYLSQNHCLETLEFTMDASRYRKHYFKMASRAPAGQLVPGTEESNYVLMLWQRLVEAYIAPNGPREVNLPSDIRDSILALSRSDVPPHPASLDPAVGKVYELMEDSVLVPFLNSFYPQTAHPDNYDSSADSIPTAYGHQVPHSYDERVTRQRARERRSSPPLSASSPVNIANRASAPSSFAHFARSLSHSTRNSNRASFAPHSYQPPASSGFLSRPSSTAVLSPSESDGTPEVMSEDFSTSSGSPSQVGELMTPPTTPPMSDFDSPARSASGQSGWKKMRSSLGFGGTRRRAGGSPVLREDEMEEG
jgi:hypothetical protein